MRIALELRRTILGGERVSPGSSERRFHGVHRHLDVGVSRYNDDGNADAALHSRVCSSNTLMPGIRTSRTRQLGPVGLKVFRKSSADWKAITRAAVGFTRCIRFYDAGMIVDYVDCCL